jgi:hypothetical protein
LGEGAVHSAGVVTGGGGGSGVGSSRHRHHQQSMTASSGTCSGGRKPLRKPSIRDYFKA